VVSRLAEEHGLKVKLRRNTNGGGIIASIMLPSSVLVSDSPVEHISVLDAPEKLEEPVAPVVEVESDEEYDPYLERIEEAIAAVTGLPRRRPGLTPGPAQEVPAAPVGMFDATPGELPPGFEPTELPSMEEETTSESVDAEPEPVTTVADETEDLDVPVSLDDERLAEIVTPDFGGERQEPVAETEWSETADEPVEQTEPAWSDSAEYDAAELDDVEPADDEPDEAEPVEEPVAEADEPEYAGQDDEVAEPLTTSPWSNVGHAWDTVAAEAPEAPEAPAPVTEEPAYDAPETVVARVDEPANEVPDDDVADAPVRLQIRRPLSAAPAASALEGDFVPEHDDVEASTIFGQLRSHWLNEDGEEGEQPWTASEVDRGWTAAEKAEVTDDTDSTTRTGLPVRRPGGRLVPGGVSQEPSKVVRDPEAIRNRLAAHAAGVSRGRAAAAAQPDSFDHLEETGPA